MATISAGNISLTVSTTGDFGHHVATLDTARSHVTEWRKPVKLNYADASASVAPHSFQYIDQFQGVAEYYDYLETGYLDQSTGYYEPGSDDYIWLSTDGIPLLDWWNPRSGHFATRWRDSTYTTPIIIYDDSIDSQNLLSNRPEFVFEFADYHQTTNTANTEFQARVLVTNDTDANIYLSATNTYVATDPAVIEPGNTELVIMRQPNGGGAQAHFSSKVIAKIFFFDGSPTTGTVSMGFPDGRWSEIQGRTLINSTKKLLFDRVEDSTIASADGFYRIDFEDTLQTDSNLSTDYQRVKGIVLAGAFQDLADGGTLQSNITIVGTNKATTGGFTGNEEIELLDSNGAVIDSISRWSGGSRTDNIFITAMGTLGDNFEVIDINPAANVHNLPDVFAGHMDLTDADVNVSNLANSTIRLDRWFDPRGATAGDDGPKISLGYDNGFLQYRSLLFLPLVAFPDTIACDYQIAVDYQINRVSSADLSSSFAVVDVDDITIFRGILQEKEANFGMLVSASVFRQPEITADVTFDQTTDAGVIIDVDLEPAGITFAVSGTYTLIIDGQVDQTDSNFAVNFKGGIRQPGVSNLSGSFTATQSPQIFRKTEKNFAVNFASTQSPQLFRKIEKNLETEFVVTPFKPKMFLQPQQQDLPVAFDEQFRANVFKLGELDLQRRYYLATATRSYPMPAETREKSVTAESRGRRVTAETRDRSAALATRILKETGYVQ